ncbi:MAG: WG repeat-containing protein [Patescibacteria group bacterium]
MQPNSNDQNSVSDHQRMKQLFNDTIDKAKRLGIRLLTPVEIQDDVNIVRNHSMAYRQDGVLIQEDFFSHLRRDEEHYRVSEIFATCLAFDYIKIDKESPVNSFKESNQEKEVLAFLARIAAGHYPDETISYLETETNSSGKLITLRSQIFYIHIPTGIKLIIGMSSSNTAQGKPLPRTVFQVANFRRLEQEFKKAKLPINATASLYDFYHAKTDGYLIEMLSQNFSKSDSFQISPVNRNRVVDKPILKTKESSKLTKFESEDALKKANQEKINEILEGFDFAKPFSEGLAAVGNRGEIAFETEEGFFVEDIEEFGFINTKGEIEIPFTFNKALSFSNGTAFVRKDTTWFIIDHRGEVKRELPYFWINQPTEGLALVEDSSRYGYINLAGEEVISIKYQKANPFHEGLAIVMDSENYFIINKRGEITFRLFYNEIESFSEGLAAVQKAGKWGFIDQKGQEIIPVTYEKVNYFSEGLAAVQKAGKWGFVNTLGDLVIKCVYDSVNGFYEGEAAVEKSGKIEYIYLPLKA